MEFSNDAVPILYKLLFNLVKIKKRICGLFLFFHAHATIITRGANYENCG